MTKQEQSALKMAGFIKSQTLLLLDKLDQLDLDSCADEYEELHELAEELYLHLSKELEKLARGCPCMMGSLRNFLAISL